MEATNIIIRADEQIIRQQTIPSHICRDVPNAKTLEAMEEVRQARGNPDKKTYHSFRDFRKEMDNDI